MQSYAYIASLKAAAKPADAKPPEPYVVAAARSEPRKVRTLNRTCRDRRSAFPAPKQASIKPLLGPEELEQLRLDRRKVRSQQRRRRRIRRQKRLAAKAPNADGYVYVGLKRPTDDHQTTVKPSASRKPQCTRSSVSLTVFTFDIFFCKT